LLTCFYTFFIVITFLFIYVENRREWQKREIKRYRKYFLRM
jgi:hypothetical protein